MQASKFGILFLSASVTVAAVGLIALLPSRAATEVQSVSQATEANADSQATEASTELQATQAQVGLPAAVWSLKGNRGTVPGQDFLGTTDDLPLIVKTNSTPVLTLGTSGPVEVHKALVVHGNTTLEHDAHVGGNFSASGGVTLSGSLDLQGSASIGGALTVLGNAHVAGVSMAGGAIQATNVSASGTVSTSTLVVSGRTTTTVLEITGGDLAESFAVSDPERIPAGAVVVIDDQHPGGLRVSTTPYDHRVAGIVSGAGGINPGVVLFRNDEATLEKHVALAGRVYALAEATSGAIRPGDLLTTSNHPGRVMRATDLSKAQGAIIGKAMSSLSDGTGMVLVLVNLQ